MNTAEALDKAKTLLSEWAQETKSPEPRRLDVSLSLDHFLQSIEALTQARWGYLAAITGLDLSPAANEFEVLYHFCEGAAVLTLRVHIPRDSARLPTVCGIIPHASLFERELREMYGIQVGDIPETDHVYLPEDWPPQTYPLRKDFHVSQPTSGENQ